jgi:hypothetical protein
VTGETQGDGEEVRVSEVNLLRRDGGRQSPGQILFIHTKSCVCVCVFVCVCVCVSVCECECVCVCVMGGMKDLARSMDMQ